MTNTEISRELLPCPFCGSDGNMIRPMGERLYNKDETGKTIPPYYGEDWFRVVCGNKDCWCVVRSFATHPEAVSAWNRRAQPAQETPKSMHVEGDVHREVVVTGAMAEVMLRFLQRPASQLLTNTEAFRQGIEAALKRSPE